MIETKEFEIAVAKKLKVVLNSSIVYPQWPAMKGVPATYAPRVDIAVGPFATTRQYTEKYNSMACQHERLIDKWCNAFETNRRNYPSRAHQNVLSSIPLSHKTFAEEAVNKNARCFIAIEIENKNTRKHFMGSLINTGALGRIGLFVAWRQEVLRAGLRILEYFEFLERVEKPTFNKASVLVITRNQLAQSLGRKEWLDVEQE